MRLNKACLFMFFMALQGAALTAEAAKLLAWESDYNADGLLDVYVSPLKVIPLTPPTLLITSDEGGHVYCAQPGGEYELCFSGLVKRGEGSAVLGRLYADINGDGIQDLFLQGREDGQNSYILLGTVDGFQVAGVIEQSVLDNGIDLTKERIAFSDVDGDGFLDILVGPSGRDQQVAMLGFQQQYEGGSQRLAVRNVLPTAAAATTLASNYLRPIAKPRPVSFTHSVDHLGQLALSLPLDLPVRSNGLTPGLSLRYSGRSVGHASVGAGWHLAGIPEIRRCSRLYAYDGNAGGYGFTENWNSPAAGGDVFCGPDGRLVGERNGLGNGNYIYLWGSNSWVKGGNGDAVETRADGSQFHYVTKTAQNGIASPSNVETVVLAADQYWNSFGNKISYAYEPSENLPLIKEISYDGVEIEFQYEKYRPWPIEMGARKGPYQVIVSGSGGHYLSRIKVFIEQQPVREFIFVYSAHTQSHELILKAVQECALSTSGEECGVPAHFDYQSEGQGVTLAAPESRFTQLGSAKQLVEADWDADGHLDLLTLEKPSSGSAMSINWRSGREPGAPAELLSHTAGLYALTALDLSDDGATDLLYLEEAPATVSEQLSATYDIETHQQLSCANLVSNSGGYLGRSCSYSCPSGTTLESDGMCRGTVTSTVSANVYKNYWRFRRQDGTVSAIKHGSASEMVCYLASDYDTRKAQQEFLRPTVIDWNGDGYDDVILPGQLNCNGSLRWKLYLGGSQGLTYERTLISTLGETYAGVADVNGDGEVNPLILQTLDTETARWQSVYEDMYGDLVPIGLGYAPVDGDPDTEDWQEDIPGHRTLPVDINSDGRIDFLSAQQDPADQNWYWYVYINNGLFYDRKVKTAPAPATLPAGTKRKSEEDYPVWPLQFDADRFPDFLAPSSTDPGKLSVYLTTYNADMEPGFVERPLNIATPAIARNLRIADFDADGVADIGVLEGSGSAAVLSVYKLQRTPGVRLASASVAWPEQAYNLAVDYERIIPDSPVYNWTPQQAGRNKRCLWVLM